MFNIIFENWYITVRSLNSNKQFYRTEWKQYIFLFIQSKRIRGNLNVWNTVADYQTHFFIWIQIWNAAKFVIRKCKHFKFSEIEHFCNDKQFQELNLKNCCWGEFNDVEIFLQDIQTRMLSKSLKSSNHYVQFKNL